MMRTVLLVVLGIMLWVPLCFGAESGESLFKSLGCLSCHHSHSEKTSHMNPTLMDIAKAYQGKQQQLLSYLNGQADAMVKPEKAGMMKRYVEKTQALADPERAALADYILEHK